MAGPDGYLPPVVIEILGNDKDFLATIARDKAALLDLAKLGTDINLGINDTQFQTGLLQAKTEMLAFAKDLKNARLGIDAIPFWTELAALRAEVQAMSPFDINVDVNTAAALAKIALLKEDLKSAQLDAMMVPNLAAINANLASMFGGGSGGAGGAGDSGNFLTNLFKNHITGSWMQALGVGPQMAAALAPALPIILSTAAGLFSIAAGMTALAIAAGPTAYAILQGVSSINSANDALANAVPLTSGWQTAVTNLGAAWTAVPVPIQSAVQQILGLFNGQSAIGQQAGNWLVNLIDGMNLGSGKVSSMFMPLVVAMENALDKVFASLGSSMNSGKLAGFIQSLAAMVGPAMAAFSSIAGSIIGIGSALAKIGVGGQGLALLAQFFKLVETIASSGVFIGILSGFVTFDRVILAAALAIAQLVGAVAGILLNIPGVGPILRVAAGAFLAYGGAIWVANSAVGTFVKSMIGAVATAARSVGAMLLSFGLWIGGMIGVETESVALNIAIGAIGTIGIAALAVGLYELIQHFGLLKGVMIAAAIGVTAITVAFWAFDAASWANPYVLLIAGIVAAIAGLIAAIVWLVQNWNTAWNWMKNTFDSVTGWIASKLSGFSTLFNGISSLWDTLFGSGGTSKTAAGRSAAMAATRTAIKQQADALQAATNNASQYANALNGVYPAIGPVNAATQGLIKAEEGIGPAIAKQVTGFAQFSQGATQTYAQLMANLKQQNVAITQEMAAAQQMIMKAVAAGVNPAQAEAAVANMAQQIPQDLVMLNAQSTPQIVAIINQFSNLATSAGIAGSKTGFSLTTQVLNGLASLLPQTRAWAQQELQILGINTLPVGQQIAEGLALGISNNAFKALLATSAMGNQILVVMRHAVQSHSPSMAMAAIGGDMVAGLVLGFGGQATPVQQMITNLGNTMLSLLTPFVAKFTTLGTQLMQGLTAGIVSATQGVVNAAVDAANKALAATKAATQTASPSQVYAEQGRNWMLGLVQGIQGAAGLVQGAMVGGLPRIGAAGGGYGLGGGATIEVRATFQIFAPGGNAAQIQGVIQNGAAQAFAQQVLTSLRSGAGSVNG